MKNIKILVSLMLALIMGLGVFTACGKKPDGNSSNPDEGENGAINGKYSCVWTMPSTVKVLKTDEVPENPETTLNIALSGGEAESAQIIMKANEGVEISSYEVKVNDLKSGSNVLDASNIEVYVQHYVQTKVRSNRIYPAGWYPDAIIPYALAKNANELNFNKSAESDNQGLWITVNAPRGQAKGIYTGTIDLTVEGENFSVPVSVEVFGFDINEDIHAKTAFAIWDDRGMIESGYNVKSGSKEKEEAILNEYEFMASKKIAPTNIPKSEYKAGDALSFAQAAKRYASRPEISAFRIAVDAPNRVLSCETLTSFMLELAKASIENNEVTVDLLAKAYCYFPEIDEPHPSTGGPNIYDLVKRVNDNFLKARENVMNELNTTYKNVKGIEDLKNSLKNLSHVVTAERRVGLTGNVQTFCPQAQHYDNREYYDETERRRVEYGEGAWWYTCVSPVAPFPTYHIDDSIISARAMGWMQKDYNIDGNLYWSTNIYKKYQDQKYIERDVWTEPLAFPPINGDGYLTYPGTKYGINGPIGTIRLDAVRDAQEDYEYLYMLEELLEKVNKANNTKISLENTLRDLYDTIYSGAKAIIEPYAILNARKEVATLIEGLTNGVAINVLPYSSADDKFNVEVSSVGEVKVNGKKAEKNGNLYTASTIDPIVEVEVNGKKYVRNMGNEYFALDSFEANVSTVDGDFKVSSSDKAMDGKKSLMAVLNTVEGADGIYTSTLEINVDEADLSSANKLVMYIYCESDKVLLPKVSLVDASGKSSKNNAIGYLYPGKWNKVEISISETKRMDISKVNKIVFETNPPESGSYNFYIDNIFYFN